MERLTKVDVTFETFARDSNALLEAARVYHNVWKDVADGMYVDATADITRHSGYPDFHGLLARDAVTGQPTGMIYGHASQPGQWWHDRVAPRLPAAYADWLDDCFVVIELAVLPAYRRRGIGRALLAGLLCGRRQTRAALSTQANNTPARSLYTAEGWRVLIDPMVFGTDVPDYVVLGRDLR